VGEEIDLSSDPTAADGVPDEQDDPGTEDEGTPDVVAEDLPSEGAEADATDAATDTADSPVLTPLSDELDIPPDGEGCESPGSMSECTGIQVCRLAFVEGGRCEACEPDGGCAGLNQPCTQSFDCDILFTCFRGRCVSQCPLDTTFCGSEEDCINIGHATHGACRPD
jgi:hypothetical protein